MSKTKRLQGRIALITGASRGIGAAIAERFAAEGAYLILIARTTGGLEETDDRVKAKGGAATLVPADLIDFDAIDNLGSLIAKRWGRLDILVGNAGLLGSLSPVSHFSIQIWQQVLDLNLTANWRLIRSLDPLLRTSDSGRVIFVTSSAASTPMSFWGAYSASKAALEALAKTYAMETKNTKLRVNVIDPGATRTQMRAQAFPGEDPSKLPSPESVAERFVRLAETSFQKTGQIIRL